MPLTSGTRLGPYAIQSSVGAGGMGEVYRARDTRLDRTVAIKILPAAVSNDPDRLIRFQHEARILSTLNHPNVLAIFDVGEQNDVRYLVSEFLEGQSLREALAAGVLSRRKATEYALEIAKGFAAAHEKGVVHRDLKPDNIFITRDDRVKILDFGLAKQPTESAAQESPTMTVPAPTTPGTVMGTIGYMSPEQVRGQAVDHRSDIFSFGAVLYEMVSGKRAFSGESSVETMNAILKEDVPELPASNGQVSPGLDRIIRRCLEKKPERRFQSASDLAFAIEALSATSGISQAPQKTSRRRLAWSVAAMLGVIVALTTFLYRGKGPPAGEQVRFGLPLPLGTLSFTLSPNGRQLAFPAPGPDGRNLIWIRALDSLEPRSLPGTENVFTPVFWSPDSRFIAFQAGNKLKKIDVSGGPPQPICDTSVTVLGGGWSRDGTIIFGTVGNGIMKVPAAGGVPTLVTTVSGGSEVDVFPSFLSDGRHFAYLRAPENPGIYIGSLDTKPEQQSSKRVLVTPVMAVYAPSTEPDTGRLLFMREGSLLAQPFDEQRLELVGEPILLVDQVASFLLSGSFSASSNGVLAYRPAKTGPGLSALSWFDRHGKELGSAGEPGAYAYFDLALSPDAARVAASRIDLTVAGSEQGIWLLDLARRVSARFTFDPAPDSSPVWSPDGARIAFAAARAGGTGIYQKASNGTGKEQELLGATQDPKVPNDWSRDGRFLLYTKQDPKTKADLWVLSLASDGTPAGAPTPFANTEFSEDQGQFSPDGRWIAYSSDESGRAEIYVQPFPAPAGGGSKTQVSRGGGSQPRWRRDGKEIFYLSPDGQLMSVNATEGAIFKAGVPESLFHAFVVRGRREAVSDVLRWDVTPDGNRFLIDTAKAQPEPLTVVLNWDAGLKKK